MCVNAFRGNFLFKLTNGHVADFVVVNLTLLFAKMVKMQIEFFT